MLGTQKPSLNNKTNQSNNPKSRSRSSTTTTQSNPINARYLSKSSDYFNNNTKTSIHQFYDLHHKENTIRRKDFKIKPNTVVLMPKVYQLNFDENFVNEKELINRNDGVNSRRGTLLFFFIFSKLFK